MRRATAAVVAIAGISGGWIAPAAAAAALSAPCTGRTGDAAALIADINQANVVTGPDTVQLSPGCTYTLTTVDNNWYGPNALPPISSDITIDGRR
jgi:plastocyanin